MMAPSSSTFLLKTDAPPTFGQELVVRLAGELRLDVRRLHVNPGTEYDVNFPLTKPPMTAGEVVDLGSDELHPLAPQRHR